MTVHASSPGNLRFYTSLPVTDRFLDITDPAAFTPLPADWEVAVTDVRNSTEAIQRGLYREVNLIGASSIMATLNTAGGFELPFVFGGDGAAVCIPPDLHDATLAVLTSTRRMAKDLYGLDLRIGIVPISRIRSDGHDVLIARYRVSENFIQAVFSGGGIPHAEELIKHPDYTAPVDPPHANDQHEADYSGLECRWQNVPSAHGEIVSVIVQATGPSADERNDLYRRVIARVSGIYGSDTMCHPVQEGLLKPALSERRLQGESAIRSYGKGAVHRLRYWFAIRFNTLLGMFLMRTGWRTASTDWGAYKRQLVENTDCKKFDDRLRQTLSGTRAQREQLTTFLQEEREAGRCAYGIHSAPSALVTCLIFNYHGAHVHLVDSDNGGYAAAAVQLKAQLAGS